MEEDILPAYLVKIKEKGEGITVEFKEAKQNLPSSLFESVCSMLNRNGGHIFLGVKDDGTVKGVYKDYIKNMEMIISKNNSGLCPLLFVCQNYAVILSYTKGLF